MENRRLRAVLVELAWRMVRFQSRYHPVQKNRLAVLAKGARAEPRLQALVAYRLNRVHVPLHADE